MANVSNTTVSIESRKIQHLFLLFRISGHVFVYFRFGQTVLLRYVMCIKLELSLRRLLIQINNLFQGINHGDDLNYFFPIFNTIFQDWLLYNTSEDLTIISIITEMWTNFMKEG